jgi:hypothetical protein
LPSIVTLCVVNILIFHGNLLRSSEPLVSWLHSPSDLMEYHSSTQIKMMKLVQALGEGWSCFSIFDRG